MWAGKAGGGWEGSESRKGLGFSRQRKDPVCWAQGPGGHEAGVECVCVYVCMPVLAW